METKQGTQRCTFRLQVIAEDISAPWMELSEEEIKEREESC